MTPAFDFLTVTFRTELPMLRLQARSMARFLDPGCVNRILVVLCDQDEAACGQAVEAIRGEWGGLAGKVEILPASSLMTTRPRGPLAWLERTWVAGPRCAWRPLRDRALGRKPKIYGWKSNSGWLLQQACKLLAARVASGSHVVILDTKNFFLRPVGAADFVDAEGRPRVEMSSLSPNMRKWAEASAKRMRYKLPEGVEIPLSLTPTVHRREEMVAAVDKIEARVGLLECFFARRSAKSTEFMLLYAAMEGGSPGWFARFAPSPSPVGRVIRPELLDEVIARSETENRAMMALHRKHFFRLTAAQKDSVLRLLQRCGLTKPGETAADIFGEDR
ncbi:hypothetical protein GVY41_03430 [Frigidibacter albus]|uniref:Uncharacterized protein n=1 Tax=Frigidibacter albus TaxID=1465486 RepID=A0A6L8VEW0_9RHOB|nr:DUF6492 family protein [Frigidibacter albus]MZQ88271.1 hypothetical protein [Frigidibacter albus]NBE30055.1 hypothetical protein [Frigidibacter albus]GGH46427.1 hypothetical protein GCM10011341_06900 [Frigidibacter albus]